MKIRLTQMLFALLVAFYIFSIIGCSPGLSKQDRLWIQNLPEERTTENTDTDLTQEDTENTEINEILKERATDSSPSVNLLPSPSKSLPSPPHKILSVGDKLPNFTIYNVVKTNDVISFGNETIISGRKYGPNTIHFKEKGAWFELKNGDRYICTTQGGCIIDSINMIITKGKIKVSYKK